MKAYRIYSGKNQDALERIEHTFQTPQRARSGARARYPQLSHLMIAGQLPGPEQSTAHPLLMVRRGDRDRAQ